MNDFHNGRLVTDYGMFALPRTIALAYDAAPKRAAGLLDRRYRAGRELLAWERRQYVRIRDAFAAGLDGAVVLDPTLAAA